jgi:hypothetical protein
VAVNVVCKHSRIKQDRKDRRATRIETSVPSRPGLQHRLPNLDELQAKELLADIILFQVADIAL